MPSQIAGRHLDSQAAAASLRDRISGKGAPPSFDGIASHLWACRRHLPEPYLIFGCAAGIWRSPILSWGASPSSAGPVSYPSELRRHLPESRLIFGRAAVICRSRIW